MTQPLTLSTGRYASKGTKPIQQDFSACVVPKGATLDMKGAAFAIADGISSSDVSQIASETAVTSFLEDYVCTSEAWSVRTAAERVLLATNSWLYSQTRNGPSRYDPNRGYVCTFSGLIIKASTAHVIHVGDSRVYRLRDKALEQLTHDHRLWASETESYLSRALGVNDQLEIDHRAETVRQGDVFFLSTDGVHEHCKTKQIIEAVDRYADDLDQAAEHLVELALEQGSDDNLTVQIVRVDALPESDRPALDHQIENLPFPPMLEPRNEFDGHTILRELHSNSRSHVYLAVDNASDTQVVLKTPSIDLRDDPQYLEGLLMEEWIARRVNSAHVMKAGLPDRPRHYLYTAMEYIEGQTLRQWLNDNPEPDLETVRGIVEQVARGLYALHRMEILHQDIRPENLMLDNQGTVKIIDFGAAQVAGILEASELGPTEFPGTALFMAPEYFLGETGTTRSDLFSLGVLAYHLLSGDFPYGTGMAKCRTATAQRRLIYQSVLDDDREIPSWIDQTLRKAVQVNPEKRYQELSEFIHDLRHPNPEFLSQTRPPLLERNPVAFWQGVSAILAAIVVFLLAR
ncbi:bifunctional protein-serine/threonine kinase/phosphatase [Marinobacter sp. CHS3-4]|uniref:bifunctional protein-serine/threonine kinase/phosphatase n=1 Tax=Marinobacter sp. CHS3-4 TaxID=3045174 RepID=UPI0024B60753|nr:bifunctional protein-serine/threonine kinase/phosphatase [Marinobacter sp. CHS3-4]MDI9244748.1 bifunctional protein-serine/threonine kinase/phosphatase [Marinobacter sp. CHS3-4]